MLLRFGCENFRSIGPYQELLLTANLRKDESDSYILKSEGVKESVLPLVAIYGANASGKTNMLRALKFITDFIVNSHKEDLEGSNIPKFKLIEEYDLKEQLFDIDFLLNDIHYHYGFVLDGDCIAEEWLYSFSYKARASKSVLFHRNVAEEIEFYFGSNLKGKNKSIATITNKHSLFLSVAEKSNHELLSKISNFFKSNFSFRFSDDLSQTRIAKKIEKYSLEDEISAFLSSVDVGSTKIRVEKYPVDDKKAEMHGNLAQALKSVMDVEFEIPLDEYEYNIEIDRKNNKGKNVPFKFLQESLGTRALISLLVPVFMNLKTGGVLIVDELESSLHTLLSKRLVELFSSPNFNKNGAQLVFTTHETQLLNFDSIRREHVWLTEKCMDGATHISPLTDYKINKKVNLRNGYLDGRFGSIPFFSEFNNQIIFGKETKDGEKT